MYIRDKAIKEISEPKELIEIILKCKICHIGFCDEGKPYVLAFNFGFENDIVYIHCAKEGYKLDILKRNPQVCIEFDTDHELFARNIEVACSWRMRYRSVVAWGKAEIVQSFEEKVRALNIFMKNYSELEYCYSLPAVNNIHIIAIKLETITGRKFEYN
jgi:uncharacterized protein